MHFPRTRAEAKASNSKFYFTGKPCKHGHISPRLVKGTCMKCQKLDWEKQNDRRKELPKSEASKAAGRRYYQKNTELVKARAEARPASQKREYKRRWDQKNQEHRNLQNSLYKRRHRHATPKWLTKEQRDQIKYIYLPQINIFYFYLFLHLMNVEIKH